MNITLTPEDWELISAYLDGQLSEAEHRRVQDLLTRRPELRQGLEELRRTQAVLRAAPRRRAPRSFTLTPEMARRAKPGFHWGWAPSLSFTSALATMLLVLSFALRPSFAPPAAAPIAAMAPLAAQSDRLYQEKNAGDASGTSPIIIWNDTGPASSPMGAGGLGGAPATDPAVGKALIASPPGAATELNPADGPNATASATPPLRTAAVQPPAATAAAPAVVENQAASSNDNGPILGVAPLEERGKIIETPVLDHVQAPQFAADQAYASGREAQAGFDWPLLQTGLAAAALLSGLAAGLLWWRARH